MSNARGMGTTRKGRPLISLQTIVDRLQGKPPTRHKVSAVSVEDAEQAANVLQRSRGRGARFRDSALAGGTLSPIVRGVGRAVEKGIAAPRGQRLRAAAKGFASTNRAELGKHIVEGGLGGAVVAQGREGLEVGRARRNAMSFLSGKTASALGEAASIGKKRIMMHAGDVWGHGTVAARQAANAAGHAAVEHAPAAAPALVQAAKSKLPGRALTGVGLAVSGGVGVAAGKKNEQHKLASSLAALGGKIKPVPTSKLRPIVDDEIEFEV
jgi:hypothetical protein